MAITEYNKYMEPAASKGKLAEYQDYRADTKAADANIDYGMAVELTGAEGTRVTTFAGGTPFGVTLAREYSDYTEDNSDDKKYEENEPTAVIRQGTVWVEVVEDVVAGDSVYVDNDTGNFRASEQEDSSTVGTRLNGAAFKSSANSGELVKLEMNLPA
ncbi:hypothetical protein J2S78_002066 [Salibacterium salarium]|uniref:structural cement protein Gp24 n=1 Tax=Salibacterium salarium TaxID=284579 RepID=UPI0027834B8B|nr:hypothetical protein [Salibacterium salarium]MDQ0299646.1 hypothetical protein [Salibacterium salarium]